eukprot:TRINITY_DN2883_c0_g1_i14.p1 TRINITY_DN2883_c0_g1~~TRINITY_DN2883_c0_g1_i14.p1  ORF type:complete len:110 (+),score=27.09 TRINITY_DN2883_c0_g1_i14:274-603(+)
MNTHKRSKDIDSWNNSWGRLLVKFWDKLLCSKETSSMQQMGAKKYMDFNFFNPFRIPLGMYFTLALLRFLQKALNSEKLDPRQLTLLTILQVHEKSSQGCHSKNSHEEN